MVLSVGRWDSDVVDLFERLSGALIRKAFVFRGPVGGKMVVKLALSQQIYIISSKYYTDIMKNRFVTVALLLTLFTTVVIVGTTYFEERGEALGKIEPSKPVVKQEVSSLAVTDGDLLADIATDNQRAHVIWQTASGFYYTNQVKDETTWNPTATLPIPPTTPLNNGGPRLISTKNHIVLFYGLHLQRIFSDQSEKTSWGPLPPVLGSDEYAATFDIAENLDQAIIAVAQTTGALDVLVGSPEGTIFQRRTLLTSLPSGRIDPVVRPSIALEGNTVHILWARQDVDPQIMIPTRWFLYYFRSDDLGNTWSTNRVREDIDFSQMISSIKIIIGPEHTLWVFYISGRNLFMQSANKVSRPGWGQPVRLSSHMPALVEGIGGNTPRVLWVDPRFRGQEWWGRIPFHQLFRPSDTPDWRNNDIFIADPRQHSEEHAAEQRITLPFSYTDPFIANLRSVVLDSTLYLLRIGRSKVGYTLDQFGAKPELFVHEITLD